jgi:CheY-like chemotaxis protein
MMNANLPILLADDDENDVFLFQRAARDAGIRHPLSIVRDGQEVIDYLAGHAPFADRAQYPFPCLIILDIKMPRKTGLEVLEWLSGQPALRNLPVMMFSSSTRADDIERAYALGANAFVVKPSSLERRAELARLIKGFWLDFNQPPLPCRSSSNAGPPVTAQLHQASNSKANSITQTFAFSSASCSFKSSE